MSSNRTPISWRRVSLGILGGACLIALVLVGQRLGLLPGFSRDLAEAPVGAKLEGALHYELERVVFDAGQGLRLVYDCRKVEVRDDAACAAIALQASLLATQGANSVENVLLVMEPASPWEKTPSGRIAVFQRLSSPQALLLVRL